MAIEPLRAMKPREAPPGHRLLEQPASVGPRYLFHARDGADAADMAREQTPAQDGCRRASMAPASRLTGVLRGLKPARQRPFSAERLIEPARRVRSMRFHHGQAAPRDGDVLQTPDTAIASPIASVPISIVALR